MSTQEVADFIVNASLKSFPWNVVAKAKAAIRDTLGVSLAAHKDKAVEATRKVAIAMGGKEESTLIGIGVKVPCNIAAWANTIMASTLDMDDGSWGIPGHKGHLGGIVVPSSLAVGERRNARGKDLLEAVVIGYEVGLRTGSMLAKSVNHHIASGTPGAYGATAAAGKLLGLSSKEMVSALGISEAHSPQYRGEGFYPVSMTKEVMGWGAATGVSAALLALEGFTGPLTVYDLPNYDREPLETLEKEWEILNIYFKPYCACRLCHASIDGAIQLSKKHDLSPGDISKIIVGVPSNKVARDMANYTPATPWQAQYSIPFTIAAALVDGEVGPEQIAEGRLGDRSILAAAKKVKLVVDPATESAWPKYPGSRVKIERKDGRQFEILIEFPRGGPESPFSKDELIGKFRKLATKVMGPNKAEDLLKCLEKLEDLDRVSELAEILGNYE